MPTEHATRAVQYSSVTASDRMSKWNYSGGHFEHSLRHYDPKPKPPCCARQAAAL